MKPLNIIIVEDDDCINQLLVTYLKHKGHNTFSYSSYEDVKPDKTIDLYFLDCQNKYGIDGTVWLDELGEQVPKHKRVLMSGGDYWGNVPGYKLKKPFELNTIDNILEKQSYNGYVAKI